MGVLRLVRRFKRESSAILGGPMLREPVGFSTNATCYVIRDAVSDAVCHRLIAEAESRGIAVTGADYPPSYRDNDRLVFDDPKLADWLFDILGTELPRELADDGGTFSLVGLNPRFRVCRYQDGQSFRIHQDGAHTVCDDVASRLTCQIYLNSADEFSGGATRFYAASSFALLGRVSPVRGTAIVFDHRLWHDGEAVPSGRKYVLRTDVLYRYTPHRRESTQDMDRADSDCIVLRGHHGYVWSVLALGPGRLASSSRDRTIRLWERAGDSWICRDVLSGSASSMGSLALVDDTLWSGSRDHTLCRWDLSTGQATVLHHGAGAVLCITKAKHCVLVATADGWLRVFAADGTQTESRQVSSTWLWSVAALAADRFVCGDEAGVMRILSKEDPRQEIALCPGRGAVHALHTLADGRLVAGFADGSITVYQSEGATLREQHHLTAHHGEVYALASRGQALASGGEDGQLHLWDLSAEPVQIGSIAHPSFVRSVTFCEDGTLVSGCYDGLLRVSSQLSPRLDHHRL